MVKKTSTCLLALMMVICLLTACAAKASVTVQVIQNGTLTLEKTYRTNAATLEELLLAHEKELGAVLTDSDYGKFVEGMNGVVADPDKREFYSVGIDGEEAAVGIHEIALADGACYQFTLTNY